MSTTSKYYLVALLGTFLVVLFWKEMRWIDVVPGCSHCPPHADVSGTLLHFPPPLHRNAPYQPSSSEEYVYAHAKELGYLANTFASLQVPSCKIFTDPSIPVYASLQQYRVELAEYSARAEAFRSNYTDLRTPLRHGHPRGKVCRTLDLGLDEIFKSKQLSHGGFGYAEPLIPPLRHPEFCFNRNHVLTMTYMVHDWPVMCQRLTPFSRTVFLDVGASLSFHEKGTTPAMYILDVYKKFGFHFDHVYAFEIRQQQPAHVFKMVPSELLPNYHWMNVGVEADPQGKLNPLRMLLEQYTEEDFIVVKLDIDTGAWEATPCFAPHLVCHWYPRHQIAIASFSCPLHAGDIEVPLALQLLNDKRFSKLVDQLYFEHHVFQKELALYWGRSMNDSIKESLDLFRGLRHNGIASHYWV